VSTKRPATAAAGLAAVARLAAACGSTPAAGASHAVPAARLPLATSAGGPNLPGWAAVEMGGSAAAHENFWELFSRPAGSAQWKLATPPGVASNGGLIFAAAGSGLVTGFGPSQDLTFSPLAAIASPTGTWSQNSAPVVPGLAGAPDALAAGPDGKLLALAGAGQVLQRASTGASWRPLASLHAIASTGAGRACGLTALTAVAYDPSGSPLAAGTCARAGQTGIFRLAQGGWQAAGPAATGAAPFDAGPVTVLGLSTIAGRTTAVLATGTGRSAEVAVGWSGATGGWTVSAPVRTGGGQPRSLSIWAGGGAAIVLAGAHGDEIAGPGARWRALPQLPARTATLALGPDGQLEALAAGATTLTVSQLTSAGTAWTQLQEVKVTIPYGSSS
jgi:hypothetical protein